MEDVLSPELQRKTDTEGLAVCPFDIWTDTQAFSPSHTHEQAEVIL